MSTPTPVVLGKPIQAAPANAPVTAATPVKSAADAAKDRPQFEPNMVVTKDNINDVVGFETIDAAVNGLAARGYCRKCGWQTHQTTEADARAAVVDHAKRHIVGKKA